MSGCYQESKLKHVKSVSCVDQLCFVKSVTNVPPAASNLPVGARLQNSWQTWLDLEPNLARSPAIISCYVNPHRNLLEALHQVMTKNPVELVQNKKSLGFFNRLFLIPKPTNRWRPLLDLSKLNLFLKSEKFKMETPETIRTSLQQGDWVTSIDFRDAYFHIPIQEQSRKYLRFHIQGRTHQFKALPFGLSTAPMEFTCSSKGGKTDGHTQGYKDPQVPRRLVGESQVPPSLSPAYTGSSKNVLGTRVAGEFREIRAGSQTSLGLCRLPVQPQVRSGPTGGRTFNKKYWHYYPDHLSGPAIHVLDRAANCHRETSSPCPTSHETHIVASQKQLEGTGITGKGHSNPRSLHPHLKWWYPHLKWWLEESSVLQGQPLHPLKHALQIFTDASKEGWGARLNEHTARGTWSVPESKLHINYLELKAVFLALKQL